jgi:Bacterial PH domain
VPVSQRVIVARRALILLHCLAAAAVFGGSLYILTQGRLEDLTPKSAEYALVLALGGFAGLVASLARFVRPPKLTLTPSALIVRRTFGGERRFAWEDVKDFYVTDRAATWQSTVAPIAAQSNAIVSVQFVQRQGLMALASGSSAFGRDDVLPAADFGIKPDALVSLLNEYRTDAVAPERSQAPAPAS